MITTSGFEKRYIKALAQSIRARRILEVGVFKGQTTAVLSDVAAASGGYVIAIDPMQWASTPASIGERIDAWLHPSSYEASFWRNVSQRGHDNVRLYRNLSTDPVLLQNPHPELAEFDLAFLDGEHTYEATLRDLRLWGSRVVPGGLILMHDVRARFPGVQRVFQEYAEQQNVRALWPVAGSVGVLQVQARLGAGLRLTG